MRKADDLRRWLEAAVPALVGHADQLQIYVEKGQIAARQSRSLSYEYRYTLKIGILDHAGSADDIIIPLLAWIEREQPELLRRENSEPFRFEAEILDGNRVDLLVSVDLTEAVLVLPRADGSGFDVSHPPSPDFTDAFPGVGASWLWQCYGATDLVAQTSDPDAGPLSPHIPPDAPAP